MTSNQGPSRLQKRHKSLLTSSTSQSLATTGWCAHGCHLTSAAVGEGCTSTLYPLKMSRLSFGPGVSRISYEMTSILYMSISVEVIFAFDGEAFTWFGGFCEMARTGSWYDQLWRNGTRHRCCKHECRTRGQERAHLEVRAAIN